MKFKDYDYRQFFTYTFYKNNAFINNLLAVLSGTAIAQAIPLLFYPLIARYYTPFDFGIYGIYLVFISIISPVTSLRYDIAILIPADNKDGLNLLALSIILSFLICIIFYMFLIFSRNIILDFFGMESLRSWIFLLPIHILFVSSNFILFAWATREQWFKLIGLLKIIQATVSTLLNIYFGYYNYGFIGLILSVFLGQLCIFLILCGEFYFNERMHLSSISARQMVGQAKKYIKFPKINTVHSIFNSISLNFPVIILNMYFNSSYVGYYTFCNKVILTPLQLFSSSLSQVFNQRIAKIHNSKKIIFPFLSKILKYLVFVGIVPTILFILFSSNIFKLFFGSEWEISGIFAQLLSPWYILLLLTAPFSFIPQLKNKQKKAFLIEVFYVIVRICSLMIGVFFNNVNLAIALFGIAGFCVLVYNLFWYIKLSRIEVV